MLLTWWPPSNPPRNPLLNSSPERPSRRMPLGGMASHLQHAGHDGAAWEVAIEVLLVGRHLLHTDRALACLELDNLVDEEERVAVWQDLLDAVHLEDGFRLRCGRSALIRRCARARVRSEAHTGEAASVPYLCKRLGPHGRAAPV